MEYLRLTSLRDTQRKLAGNVRADRGRMEVVATFGTTVSLRRMPRDSAGDGPVADVGTYTLACGAIARWENQNWCTAASPLW